jgi:hypothetical protein
VGNVGGMKSSNKGESWENYIDPINGITRYWVWVCSTVAALVFTTLYALRERREALGLLFILKLTLRNEPWLEGCNNECILIKNLIQTLLSFLKALIFVYLGVLFFCLNKGGMRSLLGDSFT